MSIKNQIFSALGHIVISLSTFQGSYISQNQFHKARHADTSIIIFFTYHKEAKVDLAPATSRNVHFGTLLNVVGSLTTVKITVTEHMCHVDKQTRFVDHQTTGSPKANARTRIHRSIVFTFLHHENKFLLVQPSQMVWQHQCWLQTAHTQNRRTFEGRWWFAAKWHSHWRMCWGR